jgi:hypothetical protein
VPSTVRMMPRCRAGIVSYLGALLSRAQRRSECVVREEVGFGCIVALHHRSYTMY